MYDRLNESDIEDEVELIGSRNIIDVDNIPDYPIFENDYSRTTWLMRSVQNENKNYYREHAKYLEYKDASFAINLKLMNIGRKNIQKIRGIALVDNKIATFSNQILKKPMRSLVPYDGGPAFPSIAINPRSNISINHDRIHKRQEIVWYSRELFPGEVIVFDNLHMSVNISNRIELHFIIVGENIPEPKEKVFVLNTKITEQRFNKKDLLDMADMER